MKRGFLYLLLLLISAACSDHTDDEKPVVSGDKVQLSFIPAQVQSGTRADADELPETPIEKLTVLVFEELKGNDYFTYTYQAPAEETGTDNKYRATLRLSDVPVKLLFIANLTDTNFGQLGVMSSTLEEATKNLQIEFSPQGISRIPMYGEISLPDGLKPSEEGTEENIPTIPLLRSVAVARVKLNTENNIPFTLQSAQAYRANDRIQIIPNKQTWDEQPLKVSSPSIPEGTDNTIITKREYAEDGKTGFIFLPESEEKLGDAITTDATCLIVEGIYKGPGYESNKEPSYYRIDFKTKKGNGNSAIGELLRNHIYNIEITEVKGPGTSHPEEATEMNIETQILDWEPSDHDIKFD